MYIHHNLTLYALLNYFAANKYTLAYHYDCQYYDMPYIESNNILSVVR